MYCQHCGSPVGDEYQFCSACGRALKSLGPSAPAKVSNFQRHLQLLGCLWIAVSVLNLLGAGVLFLFARAPLFGIELPILGPHFLHGLFGVLSWLVLLKAIAGMAAGFGLLERHSWARPLALVLGCISLIKIPFGTALGIYTLWVLLPARSEEEYRRLAVAA